MRFFFVTFILLYGGINFVLFHRFQAAFRFGWEIRTGAATFVAAMVIAPLCVRVAERAGCEWLAAVLAYGGYYWMAFVFVFFVAFAGLEVLRLALGIANRVHPRGLPAITRVDGKVFVVAALCSLGITVYGSFEARSVQVENLIIRSAKIGDGVKNLRIVQLSDLHLGVLAGKERLAKVLDKVAGLKPDIVVSTGDLVDGNMTAFRDTAGLFGKLSPPLGKYAVLGNHEFYAGVEDSVHFLKQAGFRVLRGEGEVLAGLVNIVGVDDLVGRRYTGSREIEECKLLSLFSGESFTVLLKHRPVVEPHSLGRFDLQLSGHTHKGQIFPFQWIVKLFFPRYSGYYGLPGGSGLYVARGTGTWGPPVRFLVSPEVTVIDLRQE